MGEIVKPNIDMIDYINAKKTDYSGYMSHFQSASNSYEKPRNDV